MTNQLPILIVEDEPDGQELVSRMLDIMNIPHEVAGDGESAWSYLSTRQYAAAIIDLALPGMDGVELLKRVRANGPTQSLPCIAVTAYHTPELKQQAVETGFDAYFPKPLDKTLLINALGGLI
jgi:CheY-like chemotaxis protein